MDWVGELERNVFWRLTFKIHIVKDQGKSCSFMTPLRYLFSI